MSQRGFLFIDAVLSRWFSFVAAAHLVCDPDLLKALFVTFLCFVSRFFVVDWLVCLGDVLPD